MSNKDHFNKFDDGTKVKHEIFREYLTSYIPVFQNFNNLYIFDFFAGKGKDENGNSGSPLIILEVLKKFTDLIKKNNLIIHVIFNEINIKFFEKLKENVNEKLHEFNDNYNKEKIKINFKNLQFKDFFLEINKLMEDNEIYPPSLMILDQYGIKEITEDIFKKLTRLKKTDFIFFISSSFLRRFNELEAFKKYLSINKEYFDDTKFYHSHRTIYRFYKSIIDKNYFLAHFSIKKGNNIYGLIFGSNHTLGIEKFLNVCWKINPNTGDANFNIDNEPIIEGNLSIFPEDNTIKKIDKLEDKLKKLIFEKKETSLYKLYLETFDFGCLPKHCNELLKKLEKEKKIEKVKTISNNIHNLKNNDFIIKLIV